MLLLSRMRKLSNNRERDLFEGFGPLAGFSGKIEIAYALGLLNDKARSDLTIIKQIRDKFAHEVLGVEWSFTHPWVADKCKELELINVFGPPIWPGSGSPSLSAKDPRGRFILTVYLLCGQLHGEAENSAQLYSPSFLTV